MMPIAPTVVARIDQVHQWLQDSYPCAYPVQVAWKRHIADTDAESRSEQKQGIWAIAHLSGQRFVITLSRRRLRCWGVATDTFLHEWAHCRVWRRAHEEYRHPEHRAEWGLAYAELYREFYDDTGWSESRHYLWRRR